MHIDFPISQTVKYQSPFIFDAFFFITRRSVPPGEYVQRLQQLKKEAPELLIPHAYTRCQGPGVWVPHILAGRFLARNNR